MGAVCAFGCGDDPGTDDGIPFDASTLRDSGSDLGPADDLGTDMGVDEVDSGTDAGLDGGVDLGTDMGPPGGSCAGVCGRSIEGMCRCDDDCVSSGECCDDYEAAGCDVEADLRAELGAGQIAQSYTTARDRMYGISASIDVTDGLVECVYTGETAAADGTRTPEGRFNTEHLWPRADGEPSGSPGDIYNLRPSLQDANNERGSFDFGETTCEGAACSWNLGGSELGISSGGAMVWQVRPETQGDVARSMFYFAIRYALDIPAEEEATLRAWHAADPVSAEELARVNAVESIQGNRNVIVDRPEVVDAISDF